MAHIGRHKLIYIVMQQGWHPSIDEVARSVTSSCPHCQLTKIGHQIVKPPMLKIKAESPFKLVGVDLIQLPVTRRGHCACLVAVDYHSKWLLVAPLKNKKSETVTKGLELIILPALPKCPTRILSDNGPEFRAAVFNTMLRSYGILHTYSTPYCPTSCGAVERTNRSLSELLRSLAECPTNWDENLARAVMVYNTTLHAGIGLSPSECLLSRAHDLISEPIIDTEMKDNWHEGHHQFESFAVG